MRCVPEQLRAASPKEEEIEWEQRHTPWSFQEATGLLKQGTFEDMTDKGYPQKRIMRGSAQLYKEMKLRERNGGRGKRKRWNSSPRKESSAIQERAAK